MSVVPEQTIRNDILLVDDTVDNLRLLTRILEAQGYRIRKTTNGRMALQATQLEPPDLILLDINMPEMTGYEVCQKLKSSDKTCHIPIIFISALDQISEKVRAFELGGVDYITKPFQEQEIIVRVRNQLLIQEQKQRLLAQNQRLAQEIQERQRAEAEVKHLNANLERQVQTRTQELQQSLVFEATLKRISDKLRDSLDSNQILQAAVAELAQVADVQCCNAVLYTPDRHPATVHYQCLLPEDADFAGEAVLGESFPGEPFNPADLTEIHEQLYQRYSVAFCPLQPPAAMLACPIFDEQVGFQGILGGLWVFKPTQARFSEMEIRLVEQVANQCAIALRQARLYEAAQAQVQELQRLNQLKDDFLSTVSHELRTPIANIKGVLQLLTTLNRQRQSSTPNHAQAQNNDHKTVQYLEILQEECERELHLIEDLLNLQHLEAGSYVTQLMTIRLQDWLPHAIETFEIRVHNQQQTLQVDIDPDLPPLTTDLHSLSRIVTELVNNACKYTPHYETIQIVATQEQDVICLRFCNTGVHIPAEELPRIFDKFYRIPNNDPWKHGGTGLGLTLVKKLVEQIGGSIAAESTHALTCFTIKLAIDLGNLPP